ncbi:MAG: hypothetical protein V1702_03535 [Candidatus Woesearchaeota archaeon]
MRGKSANNRMITIDRAKLEQIVSGIEWPDPISEFIISLRTDLSDELKLEALINSLYEDSFELKQRYFPKYADKPTGTIADYSLQKKWPAEQKVLIGAIDGILGIWFSVNTAVSAASFGLAMLNGSAAQIFSNAENMRLKEGVDLKGFSSRELRAIRVAYDLLKSGEGIAYGRIHEPNEFRAMKAVARGMIEKGQGDWQLLQESVRRDAGAVKRVEQEASYLRSLAVLWEQDPTGRLVVTKAAEEVRAEPLGRKAELHLPFAIGKVAGAAKASELYIARYELLL